MSGYVLSADADLDLDEIWDYIAADNIDAADRWIDRLFDAFEALGQTPRISLAIRFCSGPSVRISSSTAPSVVRLRS